MKFFRKIQGILDSWKYNTKCFFFPHNVLKIKNCPRTWTDRDNIMFHAIFQILVDFVELEQPFVPWDENYLKKRFTDIHRMRAYVETNYGPKADIEKIFGPNVYDDPKSVESSKKYNAERYAYYSEMVYLYNWYKNIYPNKEEWYDNYLKTTEHYDMENSQIVSVKNEGGIITPSENQEIEDENDLIEDVMLRRVLKIRRGMWT